jgi:hypothetical protein
MAQIVSEQERVMAERYESEKYFLNSYQLTANHLLRTQLTGIYGSEVLADIEETIQLYAIYEKGAKFVTEGAKDYVPSNLKYKQAKTLIDKEARFMFSKTPSFYVEVHDEKPTAKSSGKQVSNDIKTSTQAFLNEVLKKTHFGRKILQGGKDCFIGKRVALFVDFGSKITISFAPSLEFVYETDEDDVDKLTKIVRFYALNDSHDRTQQRIYKKKYWLDEKGRCHMEAAIYNGGGVVVDNTSEGLGEDILLPINFIPAFVIVNDGLTGDMLGESEVSVVEHPERYFSKLSNADIDSLRKGMNQIVYTIDANEKSTEKLSRAPGAYWDLSSDDVAIEAGKTAVVGTVENDMNYSTALEKTLGRIKSSMYEMLDIPETNSEALKGIIQSGKTLKALYWGLMTRCEEKMLVWKPALEWLGRTIIEGAKAFPACREGYDEKGNLADKYEIVVENNYPLLEDEMEEKQQDVLEVNAQLMSRKSYMKKWRELTDEEADEELKQIQFEKQLFEDSQVTPPADSDFNKDKPEDNPEEDPEDLEGTAGK